MNRTQRVLWDDGGTLIDVSVAANDWRGAAFVFGYATGDYLYIGSELPFNHKYFDVSVANAVTAAPTVELWTGSEWLGVKDLIDETAASGKSLAVAGSMSWSQDLDNIRWTPARVSSDIPALAGTYIYNLYWVRVSFSATLTSTTAMEYIGDRFSAEADLPQFYPDLGNSDLKAAFATGKTTWREQHFMAAEAIVRDLKRQRIIWRPEQLFEPSLLLEASCHKTAEIIYGGLGQAYAAARVQAGERYKDAINIKSFSVDSNESGTLDTSEKRMTTGTLSR